MTKAPPIRRGPFHEPAAPACRSRHTGGVIRFSVQGDTRDECVAGFRELCAKLNVEIVREPTDTLGSWIARAVPVPPADDEPGHE